VTAVIANAPSGSQAAFAIELNGRQYWGAKAIQLNDRN
jgi:hypothetical protein